MATAITTENNNNNIEPCDDTDDNKSSNYKPQHEALVHKLLVCSLDGKIKNLLCPIELVLEASNYSSTLIPKNYDPEIFCAFQNVCSDSYRASTPKISSRKRKNERNINRTPKKKEKTEYK
eukprot:859525_1